MKNIVILISGRGSNMEAIVTACQQQKWPARIAAVISNKAEAAGLEFANSQHIPTEVVAHTAYPIREAFDAALAARIDHYCPDLVVLAGFMRILTDAFVQHYEGRMFNIHPSLLPAFPGLHTHERALEAGVKIHGTTVHFVTSRLDHGPIVIQAAIPVLHQDTATTLAARVLRQEHVIYPQAIAWFVRGQVQFDSGLVKTPGPQLLVVEESAL